MASLARQLEQASQPEPNTWAGAATVTNPAAPQTPDGRLQITVDWNGTLVTCTYLASYTPITGHVITFIKAGSSFIVLGRAATVS